MASPDFVIENLRSQPTNQQQQQQQYLYSNTMASPDLFIENLHSQPTITIPVQQYNG